MPPEVVLLLVLCELPVELLLLDVLELCEVLLVVFELCEPVLVVLELDVVLLVEPLLSDEPPPRFKSLLALFSAAEEDE